MSASYHARSPPTTEARQREPPPRDRRCQDGQQSGWR